MAKAPVSADALAADCAALTKSVGIAAKTAGKVATDEHTFDPVGSSRSPGAAARRGHVYPSAGTMVDFAAWLTRRRERVCLAQRVEVSNQVRVSSLYVASCEYGIYCE